MFSAEEIKLAQLAVKSHRFFRWVELIVAALFFYVALKGWNPNPPSMEFSEQALKLAVLDARMTTAYFVIASMVTLKALFNWRGEHFTRLVAERGAIE
ncbi:MAG: hypothetical protein OMOMHJEC_03341 [Xanthomonadales bacterium]|nr:hypothetical protein [Xanthomonadales bacterium]